MTPTRVVLFEEKKQALYLYSGLYQSRADAHELTKSEWITDIPWNQNSIRIFGKEHKEPRLTSWMGPGYKYSSIQWPTSEFVPLVEQVKNELNNMLNFPFNSCLLNYYRNGQDSMGRHRDNEPEMETSLIASLSFGGSRKIKFRHVDRQQKIDINLHHGDLLVMQNFQDDWYHELPKVKNALPRLNLTFRKIKT
jgi:alkylated DNA repair dioxygenase AlkB